MIEQVEAPNTALKHDSRTCRSKDGDLIDGPAPLMKIDVYVALELHSTDGNLSRDILNQIDPQFSPVTRYP